MSPRNPTDGPDSAASDDAGTDGTGTDTGTDSTSVDDHPTSTDDHVPIEVSVDAASEEPPVESNTRIDILVETETYPTARLDDGRYVAWWFTADAPEPDDPAATEWVAAPTRFLAAGTLHELWEDPSSFDSLAARG